MKGFLRILKKVASGFILFYFLYGNSVIKAQDDATNTGTMHLNSGTIVAAEGSFITTASGSTENDGDFYLKGNWTNDGSYSSNSGKVIYWGNNNQTINGTAITTFYNAEISKSSNGVILDTGANVSNVLTLLNGSLDLNSNTLTVLNSATNAIDYTNGIILSEDSDNTSRVQWNIGSTTGAHIIPFGSMASDFIPLTLDLTSGNTGNVTASTYSTAPDNTPYPFLPITVLHVHDMNGVDNSANVVDRFWQIDRTGFDGIITATFTYTDGEAPANGEVGLQAQRYGTNYNGWDPALPFQVANSALNTVTTPDIITFGPYALSQSSNPLPVELLMFNALSNKQKEVIINWATASEQNSKSFTVERSKDAINFKEIENIKAAGNSSANLYYKTLDKRPFQGISYYRLKQTDFNGRFFYSQTKSVNLEENQNATINIFPSPAVSEAYFYLNQSDELSAKLKIALFDATGKLITEKEFSNGDVTGNASIIKIERNNIAAGVYLVKVTSVSGWIYSGKITFR